MLSRAVASEVAFKRFQWLPLYVQSPLQPRKIVSIVAPRAPKNSLAARFVLYPARERAVSTALRFRLMQEHGCAQNWGQWLRKKNGNLATHVLVHFAFLVYHTPNAKHEDTGARSADAQKNLTASSCRELNPDLFGDSEIYSGFVNHYTTRTLFAAMTEGQILPYLLEAQNGYLPIKNATENRVTIVLLSSPGTNRLTSSV